MKYAFYSCIYLTVVEAPSLNILYSGAFAECSKLSKLTFGPIDYADELECRIFEGSTPENINLILSRHQKEMANTSSYYTAINDREYAGSSEHNSKEFLGYSFSSITCRYPVE